MWRHMAVTSGERAELERRLRSLTIRAEDARGARVILMLAMARPTRPLKQRCRPTAHLADFSVGSVGESSIVGSGIPMAVGAALGARMLGAAGFVCAPSVIIARRRRKLITRDSTDSQAVRPNRTAFSAPSTSQHASGREVDDRIESMATASSQPRRGRQDHRAMRHGRSDERTSG